MLDCFMEGMMKTIIKYAPLAMKEPDNYEARANLMWTSSRAINGFINGEKGQAWSCHPMEIAKKSIEILSDFLFGTLGLKRTFTEIGIGKKILLLWQKRLVERGRFAALSRLHRKT